LPTLSRIAPIAALTVVVGSLVSTLLWIERNPERISVFPNLQVDAAAYDEIARQLAEDPAFARIPPLQPPGFVTLLALIYRSAGASWIAAKRFLWVCLVVATAVAAYLAYQIHQSKTAGHVAAVLTASSPALQAYVGTIQYEVLAAAIVLGLVLAAHKASRAPNLALAIIRCVAVGIFVGLAVLVREVLAPLIIVIAAQIAIEYGRSSDWRRGLATGLTLISFSLLIVGAWSAIQTTRVGRFVAITDKAGILLHEAHNPKANGTWNIPLAGEGEPSGWAFVRDNPAQELRLVGRRFLYFWGILRDGWNVPRRSAVWLTRAFAGRLALDFVLPVVRGGWLLVVFVVACAMATPAQWREWWPVPAVVVVIMLIHLVTVSSYRFAVPILPLVFVWSAGCLGRATIWSVRSKVRCLVLATVSAVAVLMQFGQWPIRYRLDAVEMDGQSVDNLRDQDGRLVRVADAARGSRLAAALPDEFLPAGPFSINVRLRSAGQFASAGQAARIWLAVSDLPGPLACQSAIPSEGLRTDSWTDVEISCSLDRDAVTFLAVEASGRVDLMISDVVLEWQRRVD
jgi:hypothetical protein